MRVNLATNYTFLNGDLSGWSAENGATQAYTTDYAFYGAGSLLVTKSDTNASGVVMNTPIAVQAGKPYAISMYARLPLTIPPSDPASLSLTVTWSDSTGAVVGTNTSGSLVMEDDSQWYRLSGVWVAPPGATVLSSIRVYQPIAGRADEKFILDALLVEQASYVGGFFFTHSESEKYRLAQQALSRVPQVINGLRLGADISLNNLTFNTIDEFGTIWVIEDIKGWDGQTSPDMPDIGRGTDDGSYDVEGRLTSRGITLSGFFIPANPDQALTDSKDRLVEAINLVRKGGWLRAHSEPTRASWVRLSGAPSIVTQNDRGRTEFAISLRAPDPIKYHWDDSDAEGYTRTSFGSTDIVLTNIGTADVTGTFTITGPAGPGTKIFNALTDETITLAEPLRGKATVGTVIKMAALNGVATLTTSRYSGLRVGDKVSLLGLPVPFTTPGKIYEVTASSDVFPYSFSFDVATDDIDEVDVTGQVALSEDDVLVVDTYEKSVTYNGEVTGHRYRLVTLTDWMRFGPGNNPVQFFDDALQINVTDKKMVGTTATLTTDDIHYLQAGDEILVSLPETADLSRKSLTANVVTITTAEPHGFAAGDKVDVVSVESSIIGFKARASNVVTLTTVSEHGISVGDFITVALPVTAAPTNKQLTTNVATITTQNPHGYSIGDTIVVALPATVNVSAKQLLSNVATLTTTTSHGYAPGDTITVTMPTTSTIVKKERIGSLAYITTSGAHGFSVGDQVVMSLPETAAVSNISFSGSTYLGTVTTAAPHGFSVGDKITLNISVVGTLSPTLRSATTSTVTFTVPSGHGWIAGDRIVVQTGDSRFDGSFYLSAVTATTISYSYAGDAVGSTATTGATLTNDTLNGTYNGSEVIESIPSTTTFTFRDWNQGANLAQRTFTGVVTNNTNVSLNGTKTLQSASGTTFTYNL